MADATAEAEERGILGEVPRARHSVHEKSSQFVHYPSTQIQWLIMM
jgi:hypothetical protein